ncbi:LacI family DNA-binding transcriptional regulator [Ruania alba]|uniref:Transcriptional regulator, LacI family n=1 Tax=Ruania alba TaxID=648782 RepID=A0A1H5EZ64_9MICO|nr:LacI family DNA-binding transcriptional regulator [Ruania alba]SED96360.1 transcriptional regulator, LacI family [Ruania alba]
MPASHDVAKRAGVSPAVVSRVYNGDPTLRISSDTRQRVLSAIEELNYVPRRAARALRMNLQSAITLVTPEPTSAMYTELIGGIERAALGRDLQVVVAGAETANQAPGWLTRMVDEGRTDGVLLQPTPATSDEQRAELMKLRVPVVTILSTDPQVHLPSVVLDDAQGIRVAVDHLIAHGHHRIGFLGGVPGFASADRRHDGFVHGLRAHGLRARSEWATDAGYLATDGRAAIRKLWTLSDRPTAVVVANVNAAIGALAELHLLGARLPEDLSIVTLHDVWYADAVWPPLTTVKLPLHELGIAAVEHLSQNTSTGETTIEDPKPQLIPRSSVQPL